MTATAKILDFNQPDSAKAVGAELAATNQALVTRLRDSTITDLAGLEQAVQDRQTLGEAINRVTVFFAPFKQMAHRLHKALCDRENEIVGPLQQLDGVKRQAIAAFKAEQDRIRREEERRIAEEQRKADQDRAAQLAAELEASGESQMAAAVLEEAIAAPPPVAVLPDLTKTVEGLKFRREFKWRFTTTEARALQLLPREYLCVDTKKLTALAKAMKGAAQLPGIDFYHDDVPVR